MFHGGDLHQASLQYGIPVSDWLDLSTGINPNPYPVGGFPDHIWHRLPSPTQLKGLERAARVYYGVAEGADIMAASGSSALIAALPGLRPDSHCAVMKQSYQEHMGSWQQAGAEVTLLQETGQIFTPPANTKTLIIVNPNNPTGRIFTPDELLSLRGGLGKDGLLIVDEAFMDCSPELSLAPLAGQRGLIILRSFGKFFGLAGMRLGFAIGHHEDIARLRLALGSWPVSGAAIFTATKAFANQDWIDKTRSGLNSQSQKLQDILKRGQLDIIGAHPLFTLVSNDNIKNIHEKLAKHAIWTRMFCYETSWLRIGLPGNEADFRKLQSAL